MHIACLKIPSGIQSALTDRFPDLEFTLSGNSFIRVESKEPVRAGPLVRFLEDNGAEVSEARRVRPSLEDVFINITGIEADVMRNEKEKKRNTL